MNSEFFGETSLLPGLNWLDLLVGHAGQADPVFWWHLQPRRGCRHPGFQDYETFSKAVRSRGCAGIVHLQSSPARSQIGEVEGAPRRPCRWGLKITFRSGCAHTQVLLQDAHQAAVWPVLRLQPHASRTLAGMLHLQTPVTCSAQAAPTLAF